MKTSFNTLKLFNLSSSWIENVRKNLVKLIIRALILSSILWSTVSCGILKFFKSSGSYHVAIMKTQGKSSIAIGKIASRDARFAPYLIDNFKDMLQLQLIDEGYNLKEIQNGKKDKLQPIPLPTPSKDNNVDKPPVTENQDIQKPITEENSTNLRELLPENLRNVLEKGSVVGFSDSKKNSSEDDFLSSEDIIIVSEKHKIQYFIQGAVGNNDSGTLLEEDSNSLVFLKIYDSTGTLKGGIAYTVNGRSLTEANLLKDVCQKIAGKLSEVLKNK
ncbi:lipoprotein [Leptospira sp. 201903070]|uniref:Lipoprotein n=1 Tax=Leptospira ainlahdjerensis TaxID=2810033 RepID=A0ABS2U7P1_9LEPT|nr:lipoprotein [Leptospira ainlahdjerensis]MBM9576367.1 lipoprotein [Leptospira ainlahdjerensis]